MAASRTGHVVDSRVGTTRPVVPAPRTGNDPSGGVFGLFWWLLRFCSVAAPLSPISGRATQNRRASLQFLSARAQGRLRPFPASRGRGVNAPGGPHGSEGSTVSHSSMQPIPANQLWRNEIRRGGLVLQLLIHYGPDADVELIGQRSSVVLQIRADGIDPQTVRRFFGPQGLSCIGIERSGGRKS